MMVLPSPFTHKYIKFEKIILVFTTFLLVLASPIFPLLTDLPHAWIWEGRGVGWRGGTEGGKVFRVRRRSLGTSTCSLRCSGRRLPFERRWYSLCPHCPVITMPPKLKTLAVKGEERILSLGVLGRALKNCQLLKYTSQDPVFSSQYPTASQRAV